MMSNLRTKVIIAALTVTLLTVGLPFQSAFAEEQDVVANTETSTEIESTAIESSVVSEEEVIVSEDAIAPLAIGDVFNDGTWEYTVIAETSATEGTAEITGYIGTSTAVTFSQSAVHNGITYTVSGVNLGSGSDNRGTLISLNSSYGSNFSSFDVSGCIALETLRVNYTGISSIDVSNNISLKYLSCYGNNISSIDVSMLPQLVELDICQNNLSTLDITQNSNLRDLCCGFNNFTNLDLSQNSLLDYLSAPDCSLNELDVTNNPLLNNLRIPNNKLLSVYGLDTLTLSRFDGTGQTATCTMTDSSMGTYVSIQTGLLDPSSVFTGPVGFTYDSASLLFRALAGSTFPTTGSFTTTQGAYTLEGDITFEYVPTPVSNPSTATPAAAGTTDGLAKTGDWGLAGIAILLGVSILGLTVMSFGRVLRKA